MRDVEQHLPPIGLSERERLDLCGNQGSGDRRAVDDAPGGTGELLGLIRVIQIGLEELARIEVHRPERVEPYAF